MTTREVPNRPVPWAGVKMPSPGRKEQSAWPDHRAICRASPGRLGRIAAHGSRRSRRGSLLEADGPVWPAGCRGGSGKEVGTDHPRHRVDDRPPAAARPIAVPHTTAKCQWEELCFSVASRSGPLAFYSEARLNRLLTADGPMLRTLLARMFRMLTASGSPSTGGKWRNHPQ